MSINPSSKFTLLSNCAYYPGAKAEKKHALNNQYAPNSKLHLLTRVYSSSISPYLIILDFVRFSVRLIGSLKTNYKVNLQEQAW